MKTRPVWSPYLPFSCYMFSLFLFFLVAGRVEHATRKNAELPWNTSRYVCVWRGTKCMRWVGHSCVSNVPELFDFIIDGLIKIRTSWKHLKGNDSQIACMRVCMHVTIMHVCAYVCEYRWSLYLCVYVQKQEWIFKCRKGTVCPARTHF